MLAYYVAGAYALVLAIIAFAPVGHEDEEGFHYGKKEIDAL